MNGPNAIQSARDFYNFRTTMKDAGRSLRPSGPGVGGNRVVWRVSVMQLEHPADARRRFDGVERGVELVNQAVEIAIAGLDADDERLGGEELRPDAGVEREAAVVADRDRPARRRPLDAVVEAGDGVSHSSGQVTDDPRLGREVPDRVHVEDSEIEA